MVQRGYENKHYGKWWMVTIVATLLLIVPCALMPQILSHFDQPGSWIDSLDFGKDDLLNFYAAFFTFAGTILLGVAAVFLSQQANDMNKRLLKIEENEYIPTIDINCMGPDELKDFALKDVFAINLDDSFTDVDSDMEITTDSTGDIVILSMTNVSKTDIINVELYQLRLKLRYGRGKSIPLPYKKLTVSLNNKVPYQSTIPFLIGGINLELPEGINETPVLGVMAEFHSTNFLGDVYVQKIKFDLISLWDEQITFPLVENKKNIVVSPS